MCRVKSLIEAVKMWDAIVIFLTLAIAWRLFKFGAANVFSEKCAHLLLQRKARKRGVNISAIPEFAWDEIASRSVALAKAMARLDRKQSSWRFYLVDYIELDAERIAGALNGWGGQKFETMRKMLIKYGVNIPSAAVNSPIRQNAEL
jgi:hypothetical protein